MIINRAGRPFLTAAGVADRMGVKVDTVYAYVSRGVLHRWRQPGTRASLFDPDEVEVLARRGRPRRSIAPGAVEVSIETGLTAFVDHRHRYRGRDAGGLARRRTFEQVAEWLWTGAEVDVATRWEPLSLAGPAPGPGWSDRDRLRLAVVGSAATDPLGADLRTEAVVTTARTLLATMVAAVPLSTGARVGRLPLTGAARPEPDTLAGRLTARLGSGGPRPELVAAVNGALVLLADHELATSTLAARVAASVRAAPYEVVLAGMGTVAGPLHGGSSGQVHELLDRVAAVGPERALAAAQRADGTYPGFGHPLYPDGDPRAVELLELVRAAGGGSESLGRIDAVLATARRRARLLPNVDFALAALGAVGRMAPDAGECLFTVARSAGWLAHAIEEYAEDPLRFRARAVVRPPRPDGSARRARAESLATDGTVAHTVEGARRNRR